MKKDWRARYPMCKATMYGQNNLLSVTLFSSIDLVNNVSRCQECLAIVSLLELAETEL